MKYLSAACLLLVSGGIAIVSTIQGLRFLVGSVTAEHGGFMVLFLALVCVSVGFSAGVYFVQTFRERILPRER